MSQIGASSSGKTTIAKALSEILSANVIHQDQFYKRGNGQMPVELETNWDCWDCPQSIRMEDFVHEMLSNTNTIGKSNEAHTLVHQPLNHQKVLQLKQKYKQLLEPYSFRIVEGFLMFSDKRITDNCQLMFLLDLDLQTMKARRAQRQYPGSTGKHSFIKDEEIWIDPEGYVEKLVFPSYQYHHSHIIPCNSVHRHSKEVGNPYILDKQAKPVNLIILDSSCHSIEQLVEQMMEHIIHFIKK